METYEFLLQQARLFGLEVVEADENDSGYIFEEKRIDLEHIEPLALKCAVLAHELGHHMDFMSMSRQLHGKSDRLSRLFWRTAKPEAKRLVLIRERRAWEFGRMLLKLAGYKDWTVFNKDKRDSLKGYKEWKGESNVVAMQGCKCGCCQSL